MYSFASEQKRYKIGNINLGGQPGELPTLLIGTVFYGKKYRDLTENLLDEITAAIKLQRDMGKVTGNPAMLDVYIDSEERVKERLDFVLDNLGPNEPFSVDVPEAEVRIEVLKYLDEQGVLNRTIYNSINLGITSKERMALSKYPPKGAVILGYSPRDLSTDGRIGILEHGGGMTDKGLIDIALDAGIECLLLDTAATPFEHSAAETLRSIPAMKNKWGYPVGCSIHNTVESWLWMKEHRKENKELYRMCDVGSNGLAILLGADYMVYGPVSHAPYVFPYAGMVDKLVSEGAEEYFGVEPPEIHPRSLLK